MDEKRKQILLQTALALKILEDDIDGIQMLINSGAVVDRDALFTSFVPNGMGGFDIEVETLELLLKHINFDLNQPGDCYIETALEKVMKSGNEEAISAVKIKITGESLLEMMNHQSE
jgi:hypothetical protein